MNWFEEFYIKKYDISFSLKDKTTILKTKIISKYLKPKSKILVLGCGAGYECKVLKELGHKVIGVDINPKILKFAKRNCDKVYKADVSKKLPFGNEKKRLINFIYSLAIILEK